MKSKRSSNLTLNANSRRQKRISKEKLRLSYLLNGGQYTTSKPKTKPLKSPCQLKRPLYKSPFYSPFKKTPSKSPLKKRTRKSLLNDFSLEQNSSVDKTDVERSLIELNDETVTTSIGIAELQVLNSEINFIETFRSNAFTSESQGHAQDASILDKDSNVRDVDSFGESKNVNTYPVYDLENANISDFDFKTEADSTNTNIHGEKPEGSIEVLWDQVLWKLKENGTDTVILEFLRHIKEDKFPLDNIALKLFADVVKWYSCESTCQMRYSKESKIFWKLGYRLFGGRFLHFMGGLKNYGQLLSEQNSKGCLSPLSSAINFAVPHDRILREFDPYNLGECLNENTFSPGILPDMIKTISSNLEGISCCLTFDGKKIKQGLTQNSGDVDLFGFEPKLSLAQKREALSMNILPYQELLIKVRQLSCDDISEISSDDQINISVHLKQALHALSSDILEVHDLRKKKEYAKGKLIERCGEPEWKNSRYVMAISSMIAYIHDIDNYLEIARSTLEEIIICLSCLNGSAEKLVKGKLCNLQEFEHYKEINDSDITITRTMKQRTSLWHERRKIAKVTGSSLYGAVGLDGLKKQQLHFDTVICGTDPVSCSERVAEFMKYGELNEPNAMATLVGKVMPSIFPEKVVCEEGFVEMDKNENLHPFIIVSPDGSIRLNNDLESTKMAIELKCPVMDIHKSLPPRYMLQCQSEISALGVNSLVYLCWKPDFSSVFIVKRNEEIYSTAYNIAKNAYGTQDPKRPKSVSPVVKKLKEDIAKSCQDIETVDFIGIFPSVQHDSKCSNQYENLRYGVDRFELLLSEIVKTFETKYQLVREKATEAVVFLCSSLERLSSRSYSAPVCWFTKGYSLDNTTMRNILEQVLNICAEEGIHIPAISFDGQWHSLAVRDDTQKPLTKLQLQKDVWRETEGMRKQEILAEIRKCNTDPTWEHDDRAGFIAYRKTAKPLPKVSLSVTKQQHDAKCQTKKREPANQSSDTEDVGSNTTVSDANENMPYENENINEEISTNEQELTDMHDPERPKDTQNIVKMSINASTLLNMLKTDTNSNKRGIWNDKTVSDVDNSLSSVENLNKLRDTDLRVITRYMKKNRKVNLKESENKATKVQKISSMLGLSNENYVKKVEKKRNNKKKKNQIVKSLKDLAFSGLSKMRKVDLNIIYAEYIWPDRLSAWQKKAYIYQTDLYTLDNKEDDQIEKTDLFYVPAYSNARKQFEVSCIDSSHLLTRTRRKCCKGGLDGFTNKAWNVVAKSGKTNLSPAMTECIIDQMSVRTALTHFSPSVEQEMMETGFFEEARLCNDIREWWRAEDEPGISANDRVKMRVALRRRLLQHKDLGTFPPPGMFIKGWPSQLWEAILANIDAKTLLYALSKQKTYNARAFSSLVGETFFSELTLYDRRGQGTVTASEFQSFIGTTIEKLHVRLDKERSFSYHTSRKAVYPLVDATDYTKDDESESITQDEILLQDHFFDSEGRISKGRRKREEQVSKDRNAILRGSLGIRWEKARRNDSKLLPTTRMGIDC